VCDDGAVEYPDLLASLDESHRLVVAAIEAGDPEATVPTCPEFTLDRLAFHIGEFSSFWAHVVCEATGRDKPAFPPDPGPAGRAAWVDDLIDHLVETRGLEHEIPEVVVGPIAGQSIGGGCR